MEPFEPESLQLEVQEGLTESDQLESIRQQVESTIRWRQEVDENGNAVSGLENVKEKTTQTHLLMIFIFRKFNPMLTL